MPALGINKDADPGVCANLEPLSVSYDVPFYHAGTGRLEDERLSPNFAERGERADARESYSARQNRHPRSPASRSPSAILDPSHPACSASLVLKQRRDTMLTIRDQVFQLRAELYGCLLTRRERAQAKAELKRLLAVQVEHERAFDAALEVLHNSPEATGAA